MTQSTNATAGKDKMPAGANGVPRQLGKGFPVESLFGVAKDLKELRKYGTEFSHLAFAQHLGHATNTSGAFRSRLAAFRDCGVVSVSGDRVQLTDLEKRIGYPNSDEDERDALREAFLKFPLFARLYADAMKGAVLETDSLGRTAVNNHGVSLGSRDKFVTSWVESAVAAGLAERIDNTKIRFVSETDRVGEIGRESMDSDAAVVTVTPPPTRIAPAVLHQAWPIQGGEILLEVRLDHPMPAWCSGS